MTKPLYWVGQARKDLLAMPEHVRDTFGFAFWLAQQGKQHSQTKPLKGFGGAGVLEVGITTVAPGGRFTPSS